LRPCCRCPGWLWRRQIDSLPANCNLRGRNQRHGLPRSGVIDDVKTARSRARSLASIQTVSNKPSCPALDEVTVGREAMWHSSLLSRQTAQSSAGRSTVEIDGTPNGLVTRTPLLAVARPLTTFPLPRNRQDHWHWRYLTHHQCQTAQPLTRQFWRTTR